MRRRGIFKDGLSIFAMLAFIIAAIISIVSVFSPNLITDLTKQSINFDSQYREQDGAVRPAVVLAQINVFIFAAVIIVLFWGFALSGLFYTIKSHEASTVAVGGRKKTWLLWVAGVVAFVFFCLMGIGLPRAIFSPTDMKTLSMAFPWAHFAVNSWFGGVLVVGVGGLVLSTLAAVGFFLLTVILPRALKESKLRKSLRLQ
jgi:hypothetical protein